MRLDTIWGKSPAFFNGGFFLGNIDHIDIISRCRVCCQLKMFASSLQHYWITHDRTLTHQLDSLYKKCESVGPLVTAHVLYMQANLIIDCICICIWSIFPMKHLKIFKETTLRNRTDEIAVWKGVNVRTFKAIICVYVLNCKYCCLGWMVELIEIVGLDKMDGIAWNSLISWMEG